MKCLLKASPVGLLSGTVLLGLLLVSYAPVLFCEYGQWDDYPFIWDSISGNSYGVGNNFMWFTGRIPWAILYPYVFDAAGSIAGLFWIRCLSVFLLWGLGLCLLHSLRQAGLGLAVSLLGVSVALVNPSMGAVVSWAAAMSMLIGNFISALAAILFNRYYELQNTWRGQLKICLLTSSLLLASAFFYQVSAGFFMVLLFAFVQRTQKKQTGFFCRKSTAGALCLAVAYVSYAIIFWTLIDPHFHSPQHSGIATLDLDIKGKFLILSDQVGLTAMSGWLWFWGNSLALLAAGALLLVFAVSISIRKAQAKVYLYQLFLAVGMVCGPIVALSYQEDLPFRILGPVYGLVGVWLATSISAVLDFSTLGLKKFLNAGLFACIGINAVLGAIFIYEGIVKQHSSELAAVRTAITEVSRAGVPEEIVFIPPPAIFEKHTTIFPVRGRQEYFGWHSTTAFWTIKPLVNLVLNENKQIAPSADGPSIRLLMEQVGNTPVINIYRDLVDFPGNEQTDPFIGKVYPLGDGYLFSEWFGYYRRSDNVWINHSVIGWSACLKSDASKDGGMLWLKTGGTYWATKPDAFPAALIEGRWYFLLAEPIHLTGSGSVLILGEGEYKSMLLQ